jgi:hypothetical protein
MSIVGGLDIHRTQLTFDWVDKDSGRWERAGSRRPTVSTSPAG